MEFLDAYKSYLKYPTVIVDFEAFGFLSLEDFIEEGANAVTIEKAAESIFSCDYPGLIYDSLILETLTRNPIRSTATWTGNYHNMRIYEPIEPENTSCYRKYLNQIRGKENSNRFVIRAATWHRRHGKLYFSNPKRERPRIRNPTY